MYEGHEAISPVLVFHAFPKDFPHRRNRCHPVGLGAKTRLLLLKFDDGGFQTLPDQGILRIPSAWGSIIPDQEIGCFSPYGSIMDCNESMGFFKRIPST